MFVKIKEIVTQKGLYSETSGSSFYSWVFAKKNTHFNILLTFGWMHME